MEQVFSFFQLNNYMELFKTVPAYFMAIFFQLLRIKGATSTFAMGGGLALREKIF